MFTCIANVRPQECGGEYQSATLLLEQGQYRDSLDHILRLPEESQQRAGLSILCADYAGLGDRRQLMNAAIWLLAAKFFRVGRATSVVRTEAGKRDDLMISLLENLQKRQLIGARTTSPLGLAYEGTGKLAEREHAGKCLLSQKALRLVLC